VRFQAINEIAFFCQGTYKDGFLFCLFSQHISDGQVPLDLHSVLLILCFRYISQAGIFSLLKVISHRDPCRKRP